jgi:DNA polymerase III epsilon subunit-like protein
MKKFFIFDTETTGLNASKADILQLSGILVSIDNKKIVNLEAINLYFATDVEVPADASRVNGLRRVELNKLSKGLYFEDSYSLMKPYFEDPEIIAVGYNVLSYDRVVLNSNCERYNVPKPKWAEYLDIMKLIAPHVKVNRYGNTNLKDAYYQTYIRTNLNTYEETDKRFQSLFNKYIVRDSNYHDALYDSYITFMLMLYLIRVGDIKT